MISALFIYSIFIPGVLHKVALMVTTVTSVKSSNERDSKAPCVDQYWVTSSDNVDDESYA